jgi:hypothetical protein
MHTAHLSVSSNMVAPGAAAAAGAGAAAAALPALALPLASGADERGR